MKKQLLFVLNDYVLDENPEKQQLKWLMLEFLKKLIVWLWEILTENIKLFPGNYTQNCDFKKASELSVPVGNSRPICLWCRNAYEL